MFNAMIMLIVICAFAGVAVWAIQKLAPPEPVGRVAYVVVVAIALILIIAIVASLFGVDTGIPTPKV
jgi:hypothetical protein